MWINPTKLNKNLNVLLYNTISCQQVYKHVACYLRRLQIHQSTWYFFWKSEKFTPSSCLDQLLRIGYCSRNLSTYSFRYTPCKYRKVLKIQTIWFCRSMTFCLSYGKFLSSEIGWNTVRMATPIIYFIDKSQFYPRRCCQHQHPKVSLKTTV